MKHWQLDLVVGNRNLLIEVSFQRSEWAMVGQWYSDYNRIVNIQDRSKLDYLLPKDYVEAVLSSVPNVCYISKDGLWIRSRCHDQSDKVISFLDAYRRFGATVLEEICEYSVVGIPQ